MLTPAVLVEWRRTYGIQDPSQQPRGLMPIRSGCRRLGRRTIAVLFGRNSTFPIHQPCRALRPRLGLPFQRRPTYRPYFAELQKRLSKSRNEEKVQETGITCFPPLICHTRAGTYPVIQTLNDQEHHQNHHTSVKTYAWMRYSKMTVTWSRQTSSMHC